MGADQIAEWIRTFSYPAVFALLLASGVGAPVSEELILVLGGIAIAKGGGSLGLMFAVAVLGTMCGDFILYSIGRKLGPRATQSPRFKKVLTPERVIRIERLFGRYGAFAIFLSGFVAGVRAPTFLIAGMVRFPRLRFVAADFACVVIFVPLMTWLGFAFGLEVVDRVKGVVGYAALALGALIVAFVIVRKILRRRQRLVSGAADMAAAKLERDVETGAVKIDGDPR